MPPNFVFILPDQLRSDFLSCYGAEFLATPNLDSLAEQGVRYENAFSASPVCVPARTAVLTGMSSVRTGVLDNNHALRADYWEAGLRTWPDILASRGYYTAAVGKMHFYPWDVNHGFQYRVIAEDKRWIHIRDDYYHFLRERGLGKRHASKLEGYQENMGAAVNPLPRELSPDGYVADEACRFIRTYAHEGPFALMVGFPGPHDPYDPRVESLANVDGSKLPAAAPEVEQDTRRLREKMIEAYQLDWCGIDYTRFPESMKRKIRLHYAALVTEIDLEVGRIVEELATAGVLDDTVIIFGSDHGDYLGDHGLIGKHSFFESSIRVPLIVRLPGGVAAGVSSALVELRDITSTMLLLAECDVPTVMDSRPLPQLGIAEAHGRDHIIGALHDGWMVHDGRWKFHVYDTGDLLLFDLDNDPLEQHNLATDSACSEELLRLQAVLANEIMGAMQVAMNDRLVGPATEVGLDPAFGREGYRVQFPRPYAVPGDHSPRPGTP